jgi:hypothetical protein
MEKMVDAIKLNAYVFAWHCRGGATYEDVLNMSDAERKLINQMIESHFESTKKSQLPYF